MSITAIQTVALDGFDGVSVRAEFDIRAGLPSFRIVGMSSRSVDEARHRVKSAILNTGLSFPKKKVIVNLSPAELPKDGTHFDLPIAIGALEASGQLLSHHTKGTTFAGELSLDGTLLPVKGATLIAEAAKKLGATALYVPMVNYHQAALVAGLTVVGAYSLREVVQHLYGELHSSPPAAPERTRSTPRVTMDAISGHATVKRALTLAIAGKHNILLYGPPGTGKSLLAQAAASLLPDLTSGEITEATKLHSIAGIATTIVHNAPFRAPHHSITRTALIGGGAKPRPGELSLAHGGVLLLDEIPEYTKEALEALRTPLESKQVTIARAHGSVAYPADTIIVATMNPCPCGYYGDSERQCSCTQLQIANYSKRISGPLLDRFDMIVHVPRIHAEHFFETKSLTKNQHTTDTNLVKSIRRIQKLRYNRRLIYNGNASMSMVKSAFHVTPPAKALIEKAQKELALSGRGVLKTLRVARTIADAANATSVESAHVAEALQFREPRA